MVITSGSTFPYVESRCASSTPRYSPYKVSGGSIPISSNVSSSAQSSTTTAMFATFSLNALGNFRRDFSTSASNCRRVIGEERRAVDSEAAHALDVHDVRDFLDRRHDVLELTQIGDLHHEVVDAPAIVRHRHLGIRDVA